MTSRWQDLRFTDTVDSDGTPWPREVSVSSYPGETYWQLLEAAGVAALVTSGHGPTAYDPHPERTAMATPTAPIIGSLTVELVARFQQADGEVKIADIALPLRGLVRHSDGNRVTVDIDVSVEALRDALRDALSDALLLDNLPPAPDAEPPPNVGRLAVGPLEPRAEAYVKERCEDDAMGRPAASLYRAAQRLIAEGYSWSTLAVAVAIAGPGQVLGGEHEAEWYSPHIEAARRVLDFITGAE